jgi:acetylglutamate kinase
VSFGAACLLFLTDVPGVKDQNGTVLAHLSSQEARNLIQSGIATGGMQAKLEGAMDALEKGVREVIIAPGAAEDIVPKLLAGEQIGTRLVR